MVLGEILSDGDGQESEEDGVRKWEEFEKGESGKVKMKKGM